jgi:hypothetical protein
VYRFGWVLRAALPAEIHPRRGNAGGSASGAPSAEEVAEAEEAGMFDALQRRAERAAAPERVFAARPKFGSQARPLS